MKYIDLNCDMGESFGAWHMGADAEVMPWVSSINVACGFHAGDPLTMQHTLEVAARHGVAVGAHIGLPDLVGFGRRAMAIKPDELYAISVAQLGTFEAMARTRGLRPGHIKPHGALYHMVEKDDALAQALVQAVSDVDATLRVFGLAGGHLVRQAAAAGLSTANEAFADRRYLDGGQLQARGEPGAVLEDIDAAVRQALDIAVQGQVVSASGKQLPIDADTVCVHGDRADAAAFAQSLRQGLTEAGVQVRSPAHT
ncbi:MAG TPA: 5-oxoprolinase subunit PxpA [Oleiagrimonas sp.]|nr:5-oxoprolinase subunit PxpA [Oleiagrimonas sp.]